LRLKNDFDIVKIACNQNGLAIEYASYELRAMPSNALCA
jgi:hypothetical protein